MDEVLAKLDTELVGLEPVKTRIAEIAALLLVDRMRALYGVTAPQPTLHMCFTGNPGTGKTTVALRMADLLHQLGYLRRGHLVSVTRDDLVGEYVGHTAPKTKEVIKRAMGGVLFIDEAYYLYKAENERDYGAEAIEILLAGDGEQSRRPRRHPGRITRTRWISSSRPIPECKAASPTTSHSPTTPSCELEQIAALMTEQLGYSLSADAQVALREYLHRRIRPALVRQCAQCAQRHGAGTAAPRAATGDERRIPRVDLAALTTIEAADLLASRVFDDGRPKPQRCDHERPTTSAGRLANTGSVRGAAERLVVTESAISSALSSLSAEIGVPLIDRYGRGVRLTPAGHRYVDYARQDSRAASRSRPGSTRRSRSRARIDPLGRGDHRRRIADPGIVGLVHRQIPRRRLQAGSSLPDRDLADAHPPRGRRGRGRASTYRPRPGPGARCQSNTLVVVGPPETAQRFDPAQATWLLRESGSGTRATIQRCWRNSRSPARQMVLGSHGAVVAAAVAGLGVTLVSREAVRRELESGTLVEIAVAGTPLDRPWHIVTQSPCTGSTELLITHLLAHRELGWRSVG